MEENQQQAPAANPQTQKKETNVMALISYIGPLCLIPLLTKEQDEFVKFHMKQGLVLFIAEVAFSVIMSVLPLLWAVGWIVNIVALVLSIMGILNVTRDEKKELPLVGKFADKIKI
jgi:uncharacterized membrane protein